MATCQLTYQTFKDYPFTTWKMWSHFTSSFSLKSKLKLFLSLACNTWILLLDNWQQDIYGRLLKTEGKKVSIISVITPLKFIMKLWDWMAYSGRARWKKLPAKNQLVSANWWGNASTFMLWWLHTNPSKTALDWSRPMLAGFIWSHLSITTLMSPSQFALTGLYLARENFSSCSFWIHKPIP